MHKKSAILYFGSPYTIIPKMQEILGGEDCPGVGGLGTTIDAFTPNGLAWALHTTPTHRCLPGSDGWHPKWPLTGILRRSLRS